MAQIFQSEAAIAADDVALPNATPAAVVALNPLNPPFGNCKGKVFAIVQISPAADNTEAALTLIRNPDSEALTIAQVVVDFDGSVDTNLSVPIGGIDLVPDGRPVVYQVTAQVSGGAGDGSAIAGSYLEATLISG